MICDHFSLPHTQVTYSSAYKDPDPDYILYFYYYLNEINIEITVTQQLFSGEERKKKQEILSAPTPL